MLIGPSKTWKLARRLVAALAMLALVAGVCGCDSDEIIGADEVPGVSVLVVDRMTDAPARAAARGWLVDGDYAEAMICWSSYTDSETPPYTLLQGAWDRPGVYEVIIKADGFDFWTRAGVVVVKKDGLVETVEIEARVLRFF